MPREQIQYPRMERITVGSISPGKPAEYSEEVRESTAPLVHIGWQGGADRGGDMPGWVQIALEVSREWLTDVLASYDEMPEQKIFLHSETFSRDEMNKLVRVGRRARDRAWGADA